jgi:regulation of enolase protein 1 (concanavalin A-like superfamily)
LPSGWTHQDVGTVGVSGSASYDASSSAFTVTGAGADVWGAADAFHYAWRTWSGDGTIVARVASVQNVAAWVKAGVMIRASADSASPHAFMIVSGGKGFSFQRRAAAGGASTSTSGGAGTAPAWVRLQRSGSVVTASVSLDGSGWTVVGSDTVALGSDVLVGLAVSSHTTSAAATAVFDQVSIR